MKDFILKSDFLDYYDHHFRFSGNGPVWSRRTTDGPGRWHLFMDMRAAGLRVPNYGFCLHGQTIAQDAIMVVVYADENAHRGEGKQLYSVEAARFNESHLMAQYIVGPEPSTSYRCLSVGGNWYWFRCHSKTSWMSNVDGDMVMIKDPPPEYHADCWGYAAAFANLDMHHPLWAVDFVRSHDGRLVAVDLNQSPGLKGTGIEDVLPSHEAAELIKTSLHYRQLRNEPVLSI